MDRCGICGKEFSKEIGLKKHVTIMSGKDEKHCPWLVYLAKYKNKNEYSKAYLEKMYFQDKLSTPKMAAILGIQKLTLLRTLHFYKIPLRNISDAARNQIERDGVWNEGKTKYNNDSIARYARSRLGKLNPFYTAPGYEERYKKLMEASKKGISKFCANRNPKTTEDRMTKILTLHKINFVRNFSIKYENTWRLFDFLIEGKLLVEMQGNYFHANPKFYKANDEIAIASKKILAKDIWKADEEKAELAKKSEYPLLIIWEEDFCNMLDAEVLVLLENVKINIR